MISVIICSIDSNKFASVSQCYASLLRNEPHEIIRISDAKSLAEGYNRGLDQSTGDIVIFSHDDIKIFALDFAQKLKKYIAMYDLVGVAGTTRVFAPGWINAGPPHIFGQIIIPTQHSPFTVFIYGVPRRIVDQIQAMDGLFLAFRRHVINDIKWDEKIFDGFHLYDIDCTFRAYLAGHKLAVVNDLHVFHSSGGNYGQEWVRYGHLFMSKHSGKLFKMKPRKYSLTMVLSTSESDAIEVMSPHYWLD